MSQLFQSGEFKLHSGSVSQFKIDCDALTDGDIETLAELVVKSVPSFGSVYGIPTGGERLAEALGRYVTQGPRLLVDDVLTTGASMEQTRSFCSMSVIGVVIFARAECPDWITPLFTMGPQASRKRPAGKVRG